MQQKRDTPSSFTISINLDEKKVGEIYCSQDETSSTLQSRFIVPYGSHQIRFDMIGDYKKEMTDSTIFKIRSLTPNKLFIPAISYDSSSLSYDIECKSDQDMTYVFMPYNSFVGYNIAISRDGLYNLAINAKNNAPGPILYQVDIDEKPVGILSFRKADNTWETKNFPIKMKSGEHSININYISNIYLGSRAEKSDRDSFIQYLSLEELSGEHFPKDQRVNISRDIMVPISNLKPLLDMTLGYVNTLGWHPSGISSVSEIDIPGKEKSWKALQADIPREVKVAVFMSPGIPVKSGQIIYFSVKAGVANLHNHSANVILVFMDENLKKIGQRWINAQGITEDISETKFICFRIVPSDVHFISIHLAAYSKSRKPFQTTGKVWFYDFQSDVQLTGFP